jgi:GNAT superfamily N-acetyltransferase
VEPALRPARVGDTEALVALWRGCGLLRPWNDPRRDIERAFAQTQAALFVADGDGTIVASAMAGDDGHRGWLYYVAVDSAWRGRGLGARIVRHAEAWLAERGVPKTEVLIRTENATVQAF